MYGPHAVFTQTLTSNQTLPATGLDLVHAWDKVFLQIPSAASGDHRLHFAVTSDATYFPVTFEPGTATVRAIYTVGSAITNAIVEFPQGGRFVKVRNTSGCTDVVTTYKIICS